MYFFAGTIAAHIMPITAHSKKWKAISRATANILSPSGLVSLMYKV